MIGSVQDFLYVHDASLLCILSIYSSIFFFRCCPPPIPTAGYIPANNMGDQTIPMRFPRYFSGSSSTHIPPPPPPPQPSQPYLYSSPTRPVSFPTHLIPQHPMNEYHVGHVMSSSHHQQYHNMNYVAGAGGGESSYTCIGAPVRQGFIPGSSGGKDHHQDMEGTLNWGRSYSGGGGGGGQQHRLDTNTPNSAALINRFQDGF